MFLKSLEIQGFKSFASKTVIDFTDGITGVVGPNGSGKSNISDAARWVLGEQSIKNLRGTKSDDVIFNGTEKKKSLSCATVTMTFDNTFKILPIEYSEVSITRRLFRSGENKYYINNSECRLKDVRELFMDTGIGREGYSIIEQGKLDQILSNKPEDRRRIFEEAAGITKFRTRKDEAVRKLDRVDANLVRLDDIIVEIWSQDKKLESDSERAKQYLEYFNDLKDIEINLFARELDTIANELDEIANKLNMEQEQKSLFDKNFKDIETKSKDLKIQLSKLDEEIEHAREININSIKEFENLRSRLNVLNTNISSKELNCADIENRVNNIKNDIDSYTQRIKKYDEEIKILSEKQVAETENLSILRNELLAAEKEKNAVIEKISSIKINLEDLEKSKIEMSSKSNMLDNLKERMIVESNNINKKSVDIGSELLAHELDAEKLCNNISELEESTKILADSLVKLYGERDKIKSVLDSYNIERNELKNKINSEHTRLNMLESMSNSYEGYYRSIKEFLSYCSEKNIFSNEIFGSVGELFKIDKDYITAIDVALGSSVQNLVITSSKDAQDMIELLRQKKYGRITFLPIDSIKANVTFAVVKSDYEKYGICGIASELIDVDTKFNEVFNYLLGKTYIVNDLEKAIALNKAYKQSLRIVTLRGELLSAGGAITGGFAKESGIIRRNYDISDSKNILNKLNAELEKIEERFNEFSNKYALLNQKIEQYEDENDTKFSEIVKNKADYASVLGNINILKRTIDDNQKARDDLNTELVALDNEISDLSAKLMSKEAIINETKQLLHEIEDECEKINDNYQLKSSLFEKERLAVEIFSRDKERAEFEREHVKQEIDKNLRVIENENNNLIILRDEIEILRSDYENLDNEIKNKRLNDSAAEDIIKSLTEKRQIILREVDLINSNLEKQLHEGLSYDKRIMSLEGRLERIQYKKTEISERVISEYDISVDEVVKVNYKEYLKGISAPVTKINDLKNKIKLLGNVNLSAVEEYKEIHERLLFNESQRDDLIQSKDNLKKIIKDMDSEMKRVFKAALSDVRKYFNQIFTEIFGGGKGDLFLVDEDDVLNSGIEIVIQPPGKKQQTLSLFSGGERSMTAVCLLFALLKYRPAPFCILDEVDAALDEANIRRYIQYLDSVEDIQFIMITHRKTTMEVADVLYGVTMQGSGVSTVISINLEDYEEA